MPLKERRALGRVTCSKRPRGWHCPKRLTPSARRPPDCNLSPDNSAEDRFKHVVECPCPRCSHQANRLSTNPPHRRRAMCGDLAAKSQIGPCDLFSNRNQTSISRLKWVSGHHAVGKDPR